MDYKTLYEAVERIRKEMQDPAFWDEFEKKFDARQEQYEREQRAMRMTHEDMNRPFDL